MKASRGTVLNILFVLSISFVGAPLAFAQPLSTEPFLIDLSVGSEGPEVLRLQQYLNTYGFTVADTGPGSVGNETDYFGVYTKAAVAALQNAHKETILVPLGLQAGTGNFYAATRAFVNDSLMVTVPEQDVVTQEEAKPEKRRRSFRSGGGSISATVLPSTYTIGGVVSGLAGTLVLQNNGTDDLSLTGNGAYSFGTAVSDAFVYLVSIFSQPSGQVCSLIGEGGIVNASNITSAIVSCLTFPTLSLSDITRSFISDPFTLSPESNSSGAFSFISSDPVTASIDGDEVTLHGAGVVTITAEQESDGTYTSTSTTATITISGRCELSNFCLNGGICTNATSTLNGPFDDYSCSCPEHYAGRNCELSDLSCMEGGSNACLNGGTCQSSMAGGECSCPAGWTGDLCQLFDPGEV